MCDRITAGALPWGNTRTASLGIWRRANQPIVQFVLRSSTGRVVGRTGSCRRWSRSRIALCLLPCGREARCGVAICNEHESRP